MPSLAASIDPSSLLQGGTDPVQTVRELAAWVAHAYANDATGTTRVAAPNPRGSDFRPVRSIGRSTSEPSRRSATAAS